MATVHTERTIQAPAADIWQVLRAFGLPYFKGFQYDLEGAGPGAKRSFQVPGGRMVEQLLALDDDTRCLQYTIVQSPWPVKDYRATIQVFEQAGSARVIWSAVFRPHGADDEAACQIVEATFNMNLKALDRFFTSA